MIPKRSESSKWLDFSKTAQMPRPGSNFQKSQFTRRSVPRSTGRDWTTTIEQVIGAAPENETGPISAPLAGVGPNAVRHHDQRAERDELDDFEHVGSFAVRERGEGESGEENEQQEMLEAEGHTFAPRTHDAMIRWPVSKAAHFMLASLRSLGKHPLALAVEVNRHPAADEAKEQ